jgi:reverse gyrase
VNKRTIKKKQKLEAMNASKWKDVKIIKKRGHVLDVKTRHHMWGIMPHNDNYTMYLLRRRRCGKLESKIIQHVLSSKMLCMVLQERKNVKEKLFLEEIKNESILSS